MKAIVNNYSIQNLQIRNKFKKKCLSNFREEYTSKHFEYSLKHNNNEMNQFVENIKIE